MNQPTQERKKSEHSYTPIMKKEKEVTIYDIAKHLRISTATVSRSLRDHYAISPKTKKKVLEAAREMGYRSNSFARNLRTQKTNTLGVIVPRLNSYFVSSVMAGMEKVASQFGYNIIISQSMESMNKERENAYMMFDNRVDGLLVSLANDTSNIDHFKLFFDKNIPVVFFDRVHDDYCNLNVVIDNYKNAFDITCHLIEQGCKRILHIGGNQTRNEYAERYRGYRDALSRAGLSFDEELLLINDLSDSAGIDAGKKILLMTEKPDGVFAASDICAAHCLQTVKTAGYRVPGDIAFAGFNNDPITKIVEPNLTTVNYPCYEMGEVAVRSLIDHLSGTRIINAATSIVLRSNITVRASSLRKTGHP